VHLHFDRVFVQQARRAVALPDPDLADALWKRQRGHGPDHRSRHLEARAPAFGQEVSASPGEVMVVGRSASRPELTLVRDPSGAAEVTRRIASAEQIELGREALVEPPRDHGGLHVRWRSGAGHRIPLERGANAHLWRLATYQSAPIDGMSSAKAPARARRRQDGHTSCVASGDDLRDREEQRALRAMWSITTIAGARPIADFDRARSLAPAWGDKAS
jgi:hypothetical protein